MAAASLVPAIVITGQCNRSIFKDDLNILAPIPHGERWDSYMGVWL
jgi:hypothetical protein